MERGIITAFARKARARSIKERNFLALRPLDSLVCAHSKDLWYLQTARSPITVSVFVVSNASWQPGKLQLWECPGNNLIAHEHMENSAHLVQLSHGCWVTDQILFSRGMMPRDWSPSAQTKTYWLLPMVSGGQQRTSRMIKAGRFRGHFLVRTATCGLYVRTGYWEIEGSWSRVAERSSCPQSCQ